MFKNMNRKLMLEMLLGDDEFKLANHYGEFSCFDLEAEEVVYLESEVRRYKRELALLGELDYVYLCIPEG